MRGRVWSRGAYSVKCQLEGQGYIPLTKTLTAETRGFPGHWQHCSGENDGFAFRSNPTFEPCRTQLHSRAVRLHIHLDRRRRALSLGVEAILGFRIYARFHKSASVIRINVLRIKSYRSFPTSSTTISPIKAFTSLFR